MGYRYLGNTGMKVSVLSYGNWLTSDKKNDESQQLVTDCVKKCFEMGVNYFDTAEAYAYGGAEVQLGIALKQLNTERKNYVVSTKLIKVGAGPNDIGLSRKRIIEGTKASLKRLDLNYVDIIFAHRPDYSVPIEEIVRGFSWLIDNGLAFYWGTSEWCAVKFEEACQVAERLGLHPPVVEQCQYNMMARERFEKEYVPLFERRNIGTTIWSPLAAGFLTGKYNDGMIPEGSRGELFYKTGGHLAARANIFLGPENKDRVLTQLRELAQISKSINFTQA